MNDFCLIPGQGLKALHLDPNFHWMTKPPSPLGGVYMTPWRLSRRCDYTPVPSHGSIYLFTWYHHKMSCRRESRQREFTPVVVPGREFHSTDEISQRYPVNEKRQDTRCELSSLAVNGWIAEEPERWNLTSACKGALLQPFQSMFWSHLAHPDWWRHKSDRPWHRGLRPLFFSNNVTGSFTSPSNWRTRMKKTRPTA